LGTTELVVPFFIGVKRRLGMAILYFKLNFECNLFATSAEDRKELKSKEEKTLDSFILRYRGSGEASQADYDIYIDSNNFLKGSDFGLSISPTSKTWAKGVVKIKPKADLYEYLALDKKPRFYISHVTISPYLELYPDKKKKLVDISCVMSKKKPSM
tara:strand:+ start:14 stop:484 length:471 start_codon:yes stop_codon:yes gene_type:complete